MLCFRSFCVFRGLIGFYFRKQFQLQNTRNARIKPKLYGIVIVLYFRVFSVFRAVYSVVNRVEGYS